MDAACNDSGDLKRFLESFNESLPDLPSVTQLWQPTSFDHPLDIRVAEAVEDLTRKMSEYVFPKLGIRSDE